MKKVKKNTHVKSLLKTLNDKQIQAISYKIIDSFKSRESILRKKIHFGIFYFSQSIKTPQ